MQNRVILKRTKRLNSGHLWIFSNEIKTDFRDLSPGHVVDVYDAKDNYVGAGYFNPNSLISIRLLTRQKEEINKGFFLNRIKAALHYRRHVIQSRDALRLIYSEGDFLPGIIVDKYGECLVIQILTLGMERLKELIVEALNEILLPSIIILRNDCQSRMLEGLPRENQIVKGDLSSPTVIKEGGIKFEIDLLAGQKTGFFLDQSDNRLAASRYIKEAGKGLDVFCYSGAWGLHLANKNGASVIFVDDSEKAIQHAKINADLNGLAQNCTFVREDAFSFLKKMLKDGSRFDFIILDPPAFVKSRARIREAIRGYRDINQAAIKLLKKDGILITSSCSYHIDRQIFLDIVRAAAQDAGRAARLLEYRSQSFDHPILLSVPETEYLKCAFIAF